MWSHYADKHKGICLGFKVIPANNFFLMHVKYIKQINALKYWKEEGKIIANWAFTKSYNWSYEK